MFELLLLALGVAFYVAWSMGSNSEMMATTVGSGIFSIRRAVMVSAIFTFIGALTLGRGVMETIGKGIIHEETLIQFYIAPVIIGAVVGLWLMISTWRRIPISTTHSIVGAILGFGLAQSLQMNWTTVSKVILSAIFSPIVAIVLAILFYHFLVKKYLQKLTGVWERERREVFFGFMQVIGASLVALSFGANDVSKAVGILVPYFENSNLILLQLLGAAGMSLGVLMWSYRVLRTVGKDLVELIPSRGFIIEISTAISVLFFTFMSMPVSTSHTLVGATVGTGIAYGVRKVRMEVVKSILFNWVVTIPFTMLLAAILTKILI
ncbi:MAG: inorganic phosphate transporter [Candidatus Aenigmarchaeota archaeon]|nr:inorganic phosphate transporter [Candidatus Aenigmarchaeota archaeon]